MAIIHYKKNNAGRRGMSAVDRSLLSKERPLDTLVARNKQHAGRNNQGRITCRHRGAGEKRLYRLVDFNQAAKAGIPGRVEALEYDPNRTVWIMLVVYVDGDRRYHIAADGVRAGDDVLTAPKTKIQNGFRCQIGNIPSGFSICNLELTPGKGGQIARSAGSSAKIVSNDNEGYTQVQLPSSEIRIIPKTCYATIGVAANTDHSNVTLGKAGRVRHMGRRPQVRGKVMNPCDHPHGGGEARNSIGQRKGPKTPWGALALGVKTRKPGKYSNGKILARRKPGRFSNPSKLK